ncbi:hypothetical protein F1559_001086 [Cyanidiococcus yangmingshanensis]|uniref:P-type ATPase A domain-containing protein n=1 Tax=Cyanidiococcus yangmingshanensis TaxID=2690220 RepID=A0A7J7IK41_9RHOD|nr:hypothetical protein F1559_001086 [Cyanidiococcus yangmingshanensis]
MSGLNGDRLERISSRELVPGDVVVIESGMIVPCDCTLLVGSAVVTEANLTGEASPLFKSPWRSAYEEPSSRLPRSRVDERQALAGNERSTLDHETESPAEEDDVTTDAADGDGDENEDDVLSTDEGESYFMGAYSASNEADDLLPTPAFHNMSVRVPDSWIHTQELRAGEPKGTVTASLSPPSPSAPVSGSSEQSRHFHRQRRHHRRGRTLRMEYHRAHAVPEYHLAWDQPSHVLYAGTRVIEARPEMTIDNSGATSVSTCTNLERSSPSGAMSSAASTTAWSALGPPPDELDKQIDARVLAVVTRTRLDTAKGVLLHQILLADDETSRYERGRSSAERDTVRERPKSPLGVLLGIFSRPFSDSTESSSAITERPDSATMEKRLSQMYLDAYQAMIILLICGLFGAAYSFYILRPLLSFRETLLSALDLLTIVVPPAMPAAVTFGIVFALERLLAAHIFCIRPPAVLIASGLEVVCFDKTGTLTDLGLDVHELLPVAFLSLHPVPSLSAAADTISPMAGEVPSDTHVAFFDTEHALRQANGHAADQRRWMASTAGEALAPGLALVMGCCHTLAVVNGQVLGDEVDLRLFELTGYELWPSPREPDTKQWIGIQPAQALFYVVDPMTERSIARVVKVFAFSSEHARMGVIAQRIRRPEGSPPEVDWLFLVKGAPEVVVNLCDPQTVPNDFVHQVQLYTSQGLRVLALAGRRLASGGDTRLHRPQHQAAFTVDVHGRRIPRSRTGEPTQTARARSARNLNPLTWSRRRLERSLTLYGLAVLENRLKPDTAAVLHELRIQGSLHCPMVTGDHIRTAVSVARQAGMMDRDARVIIADEASSHAEQGNRRLQTTSGRQSGRAGSTLAISGSGAEAGNQVVFYDSMHVHKRFSRMEVFSMLAGSSGMSAGPSSLARTFATASSAPAPATDWAATGTGVSSDAATVRESAEGAVPVSAVTSASTSGFPFESSLLHDANVSTRNAAWPPNRCSVRAGSNRDVAEPHEAVATASIRGDETSMSVQEFRGAGPVRPLDAALGSTEGVDVSLLPSRRHRVAGPGRPATTWALAGIPALTSFHDEEPVALAMTGAAFRILLREFHRLTANLSHQGRVTRPGRASSRRYHFLRQVFLRCAVYARMSAADKTALVHLLRSRFGLCVGMCGDGANDAGALREADVGIGLVERRLAASTGTAEAPDPAAKLRLESLRIEEPAPMTWSASTRDTSTSGATQAETSEAYPSRWTTQVRDSAPVHSAADDEDAVASLAAPFTSSVASIRAVVKVIAEGRGAAASSLACFRYMGIYSLTQSISTLVLYRLGTVYSDSQFLFQDLVLIMPLAADHGSDCLRAAPHPSSTSCSARKLVCLSLDGAAKHRAGWLPSIGHLRAISAGIDIRSVARRCVPLERTLSGSDSALPCCQSTVHLVGHGIQYWVSISSTVD